MPARRQGAGRGAGDGYPRRPPAHVGPWTVFGPSSNGRGGWVTERRHKCGERESRTRTDYEEAALIRCQWIAEAEQAIPVRMSEAVDAYLAHLRAKGRRESTITDAGCRLHPIERLVDHVQDLSRTHVERRMAGGGRDDSRAQATRDAGETLGTPAVATRIGILARIRDACRYWKERGWLPRDPTAGVRVEGRKNRGKLTLTPLEAGELLSVLRGESSPASTAVSLALLLGLRRNEVLGLRIRDWAPRLGLLSIGSGGRETVKNETAIRTRPVDVPWLAARLTRLTHDRELGELLFVSPQRSRDGSSRPYGQNWLLDNTRRLAGLAELEEERVAAFTAQGLRGTWRRLQLEAGASAAQAAAGAGHGQEVARRHYAPGAEEAAGAKKVQDLFAPKAKKRTAGKKGRGTRRDH